MNLKYFYRFKYVPIAHDYRLEGYDTKRRERDVKKYCKELNTFEDLLEQFHNLKTAYDTASKMHADIVINILPDILGVTELHVHHHIRRKLFSRAIKRQFFWLAITKEPPNDMHEFYEYETVDIEEVKTIFHELIVNQRIPDLSTWNRI